MASEAQKLPTNPEPEHHAASEFVETVEKDIQPLVQTAEKDIAAIEKDIQPLVQTVEKDIATLERDIQPLVQTLEKDFGPLVVTLGRDVKPLEELWIKFNNDWSFNLAAALAYSLLTAIFPIIVATLSIFGFFLGTTDDKTAINGLVQKIFSFLPTGITPTGTIDIISKQLPHVSGILGVVAVLISIYFGSRLFILMEGCFSITYHVRQRSFVQQNLIAIGMVLLTVLLIAIIIGLSTVFSFLGNAIPGGNITSWLANALGTLIGAWLLFQAIYTIVPNQHIFFRNTWRGAITAAVAIEIYLQLFPLYITHFLGSYAGNIGFAVILLVFFYYLAIILLLGAQVNAFFAEGIRSTTTDLVAIMHLTTSQIPTRKDQQTSSSINEKASSANPTDQQGQQQTVIISLTVNGKEAQQDMGMVTPSLWEEG